MSEPLDDFNRRLMRGDLDGPATNAAESAAQALLDARRQAGGPVGGGSIDFGAGPGAALLAAGMGLFLVGAWLLENSQGGKALTGVALLILSAILALVGAGSLLVASFRTAGRAANLLGVRTLLFLGLAVLTALWATPRLWSVLWSLGVALPLWSRWVIAPVVGVVTFLLLQRLYRVFAGRGSANR